MTATVAPPATTSPRAPGRPRDPQMAPRVVATAIEILASGGADALTGDRLAATAHVGKASIYRRWDSLDAVLVDVVRELGVRDVDHGPGPGSAHADLTRLAHAVVAGPLAAAEVALLPKIGRSTDLQVAHVLGPATRLARAVNDAEVRARRRGEPEWDTVPILAAFRYLQHCAAVDGQAPDLSHCAEVIESTVLPALGYVSRTWS